jgi:Fe2+ or Zn2+ uptake regulation protein
MFSTNDKNKYLFKCEECGMIVSVDLEDEDDIQDVNENKLELSCPCGGKSKVLRN